MPIIQEPVNLKALMEGGYEFTVNNDETVEVDLEEEREYKNNLLKFMNMQVTGDFQDEDSYVQGQPFEVISSKMKNLTNDGTVKKKVIREGYGAKPQDSEMVRVQYNAYIEYNAEPFDSTYARNRPHQFLINCGEVIIGLDIAVQSMQVNEKSQFLIQPKFAYGALGCLQRVPPETEVLFEIELLEIVNIGAAKRFESLPQEEQNNFTFVYEYCLALCAKGKDLYSRNIKGAIREYNMAVSKLEMCQLDTYEDQVKQQELLLKLYSNLLVACTKTEDYKKACINFNRINELVKGTDLKISAKMYYNSAKCLRMLGDYHLSKKRLNEALKLEPKNKEILQELVELENSFKQYKEKESQVAKAFISGAKV
ncbi:unnamed protein product [Diabrotica balteata]|uniref:peptidylprolyl isomerase n=1 Tax=Diabrotica balteata TaxID=107213 RepID=A0A9N9T7X3_DIABA|nr:unnamed protein product [Diabrotica balteata]